MVLDTKALGVSFVSRFVANNFGELFEREERGKEFRSPKYRFFYLKPCFLSTVQLSSLDKKRTNMYEIRVLNFTTLFTFITKVLITQKKYIARSRRKGLEELIWEIKEKF